MWWGQHLLSDQVHEQNDGVTVGAGTSHPQCTTEEVALRAALLAEPAFVALRALVDGVGGERALAAQAGGDVGEGRRWGSGGAGMAEAKGALPTRGRAVARPGTGEWALTHRADQTCRVRRRLGGRGART